MLADAMVYKGQELKRLCVPGEGLYSGAAYTDGCLYIGVRYTGDGSYGVYSGGEYTGDGPGHTGQGSYRGHNGRYGRVCGGGFLVSYKKIYGKRCGDQKLATIMNRIEKMVI